MTLNKIEQIKQYRETDALNQSFLKLVLANNTFKEKQDSVYMGRGNYIDDMLTFNNSILDRWYYVMDGEFPTPMWKLAIENIVTSNPTTTIGEPEIWLPIFRESNKSKLLDENVIGQMGEYEYYWKTCKETNGRIVIQQSDHLKAVMVVSNFLSHPNVSHLMQYEGEQQVPLYWDYECHADDIVAEVVKCKGLVDRLIWDHNEKWVQIVDFKTTSEALYKWPRSLARKFDVPFQMSFYYHGLNKNLEKLGFSGYTQRLPCILIENVDYPGKPRIFNLTPQDILQGASGYKKVSSTIITDDVIETPEIYQKHGWEDAIYKYVKCKQLGLDDFDLEYHESKGIYDLNCYT